MRWIKLPLHLLFVAIKGENNTTKGNYIQFMSNLMVFMSSLLDIVINLYYCSCKNSNIAEVSVLIDDISLETLTTMSVELEI